MDNPPPRNYRDILAAYSRHAQDIRRTWDSIQTWDSIHGR